MTIIAQPGNLNIVSTANAKGANPESANITIKDQALNFYPPISLRYMKEFTYNPLPKNPIAENTTVSKIAHFNWTNNPANKEIISKYLVVDFMSKYIGQTSCPMALAI